MGKVPAVYEPVENRAALFSSLASVETLYGKVLLLGSFGDPSVDCRHPALGLFVSLAGGRRARIVVLKQSTRDEQAEPSPFAATLRYLGAKRVDVVEVPVSCTGQLNLGSAIPQATGVLFVGDDPQVLLASLAGSVLLSTIRTRHQNGAVIAGIGAGAAILGEEVLARPFNASSDLRGQAVARKGNESIFPGLKFLPGWVVDPSYGSNRNLEGLLLSLAANPALFGLGIEAGVGILANAIGQVTSLGGGLAMVIDVRESTSDYAERRNGEIVSISGSRLYMLGDGRRFDPREGGVPSLLAGD
jgi:cyanophycinase